jgi:hypothetical protein
VSGQEVFSGFRPFPGQFQDDGFEEEESRLFEEGAGHLLGRRLTVAAQFRRSRQDDAPIHQAADAGIRLTEDAVGLGTVAAGAPRGLEGPCGFPGTAQNDEQVSLTHGRRGGITAKVDREAQVHKTHTETAEDVAGPSLGAKENASGSFEILNEISKVAIFEFPQQQSVFMKNRRQMFLDIVPCHFPTFN